MEEGRARELEMAAFEWFPIVCVVATLREQTLRQASPFSLSLLSSLSLSLSFSLLVAFLTPSLFRPLLRARFPVGVFDYLKPRVNLGNRR